MRHSYSFRWLVSPALLLSLALTVAALAEPSKTFVPLIKPRLTISKLSAPVKIDGDLSDIGWQTAARATGFMECRPRDMAEPEVPTEAMLAYDSEKLYVAFVCYDDKTDVRATMCQRDQFHSDDAVGLLLDTYGEGAWAYEFFVNPHGVQKDVLWSTVAGEDDGFDLIWEAAARITDNGYQVEMAIPFSSLRFPNQSEQSWRINFWRNRPRDSYNQYSWAAYDQNERCWVCQWGTVEGIRDVYPGRGLEILPTIVANQAGSLTDYGNPHSRFENSAGEAELSVGAKYTISSSVTAEAAYNPDFSQIEADADQVDVNTTIALFYPERRPFFQEGSDLFRTLFNSFYTRTINDPGFAAKLTGRTAGNSFALVTALDENTPYIIPLDESSIILNSGDSYVNVLRALHSLSDNSQVGFIVTDRRFEESGSGTVLALDADLRLSRNYGIDGQWILSHTREPNLRSLGPGLEDVPVGGGEYDAALNGEDYYGTAFITRFTRSAREWTFQIDYNQVSPAYRTQTGYDPTVNYRNLSAWSAYNFYFDEGLLERIGPSLFAQKRWEFDGGRMRWEDLHLSLGSNLRFAQTYFGVSGYRGRAVWSGIEFNDLWNIGADYSSRISELLSYSIGANRGRNVARYALVRGKETSAYVFLTVKPFDRLIIEPSLQYAKSTSDETGEELYDGYITRTRFRYQANRELSVRLVLQYNDFYNTWDVDPLITYRLSPFSVFYVGSTYDYCEFDADPHGNDFWKLTSRQFFMKLQYQLQI